MTASVDANGGVTLQRDDGSYIRLTAREAARVNQALAGIVQRSDAHKLHLARHMRLGFAAPPGELTETTISDWSEAGHASLGFGAPLDPPATASVLDFNRPPRKP